MALRCLNKASNYAVMIKPKVRRKSWIKKILPLLKILSKKARKREDINRGGS